MTCILIFVSVSLLASAFSANAQTADAKPQQQRALASGGGRFVFGQI
jgi:hypothetical protein